MSPNVSHVPSCNCTHCKPTCATPPTLSDVWCAYDSDGKVLAEFAGCASWMQAKSVAQQLLRYAPFDVRLKG